MGGGVSEIVDMSMVYGISSFVIEVNEWVSGR